MQGETQKQTERLRGFALWEEDKVGRSSCSCRAPVSANGFQMGLICPALLQCTDCYPSLGCTCTCSKWHTHTCKQQTSPTNTTYMCSWYGKQFVRAHPVLQQSSGNVKVRQLSNEEANSECKQMRKVHKCPKIVTKWKILYVFCF